MRKQNNEPLDLFIYETGIAVLWREGEIYRCYHSGTMFFESADRGDAVAKFDACVDDLIASINADQPEAIGQMPTHL